MALEVYNQIDRMFWTSFEPPQVFWVLPFEPQGSLGNQIVRTKSRAIDRTSGGRWFIRTGEK